MSDRVFLDTNVVVYAFDSTERNKQTRAWKILKTEGAGGRAVISTQVLQEFYVIVTRKLKQPLDEETAEQAVIRLSTLPVVQVDTKMVLSAVGLSRGHQLSFWDALIVQAALEGGCGKLLTEDLQEGRKFGPLQTSNPFV